MATAKRKATTVARWDELVHVIHCNQCGGTVDLGRARSAELAQGVVLFHQQASGHTAAVTRLA